MSEIVDIKFGRSLPPEQWKAAADRLESLRFPTAVFLRSMGMSGEMANAFMDDAQLALIALRYVAANASECCRFIAVPKKMEGGEQE
jgi:hypothetical protein